MTGPIARAPIPRPGVSVLAWGGLGLAGRFRWGGGGLRLGAGALVVLDPVLDVAFLHGFSGVAGALGCGRIGAATGTCPSASQRHDDATTNGIHPWILAACRSR